MLFRRTRWRKALFFPVRGRFFYDSPLGLLVNFVMGWWSMYPPFFASGENPLLDKRAFDKYSMRLLTALCHEGAGNVIGFHPEGTRNKGEDPYSFLRPQPGVGRLIKDARPQVVPLVLAGLGTASRRRCSQLRGGGTSASTSAPARLQRFRQRDSVRTYRDRRFRHEQDRRSASMTGTKGPDTKNNFQR